MYSEKLLLKTRTSCNSQVANRLYEHYHGNMLDKNIIVGGQSSIYLTLWGYEMVCKCQWIAWIQLLAWTATTKYPSTHFTFASWLFHAPCLPQAFIHEHRELLKLPKWVGFRTCVIHIMSHDCKNRFYILGSFHNPSTHTKIRWRPLLKVFRRSQRRLILWMAEARATQHSNIYSMDSETQFHNLSALCIDWDITLK